MSKPGGFGQGHDPRHLEAAEEAWLTHGLEQSRQQSLQSPAAASPSAPASATSRGRRMFATTAMLLGLTIVAVVLMERRDPARGGGRAAGRDADPQDPIITIDPALPPPQSVIQVRSAEELERWLPEVLRIKVWQPAVVRVGLGLGVRYHSAPDCAGYLVNDDMIAKACAALRDTVRSPELASSIERSFEFALELGASREIRGVLRTGAARTVTIESDSAALGPFALSVPLMTALQPAIDEAIEVAKTDFAVVDGTTLANVPRTVRHLVTYGLADADLASLAEFVELRTLHVYGYSADEALDPNRVVVSGILVTDKFAAGLPALLHLRSVQLAGTATTREVFTHLGRLPALEELVVDEAINGDYRGAAFDSLRQCFGLRTLRMRGLLLFDQATVDSLAEIPLLEVLEFEVVGPDLGGLFGDLVGKSSVEHLHLRGLDLPDDWLDLPAGSTRSLRELRVEDGHVNLEGLQGHAKLDELVLSRVTLGGREDRGLEPLSRTKVRSLTLRDMRDPQLADLPPSLRQLDLRGCHLTEEQLEALERLNKLDVLDLRDNGLGDDDVQALVRVLGDAIVLR